MALTPPAWLLSYDIASDRARAAAGTRLARHGRRLCYSVFELTGTSRTAHQALQGITASCDGRTDHALLIPLCPRCRLRQHGLPLETQPTHGWTV